MNSSQLPLPYLILTAIAAAWTILWKGLGLWKSARYEQRNWFIVILLTSFINILGLLEIIYLFRFAKKRMVLRDLLFWKSKS
ncbi:MAG: DUF5652 family protein [bacterium]|nr:DUF5652 family protein [bacterium]